MRLAVLLLLAANAAVDVTAQEPMIVLGKKQLLDGPAAYAAFEAKHRSDKRSVLRTATIKRLKALADAERPALLAALGNPPDARPLWIVNAVMVRLSPKQVESARKHEQILWVYPAGLVVPPVAPRKVGEVLKRTTRPPFSTKSKTIPWNLTFLGVPDAWKLGALGDGVVVAMFDAGVDYLHKDLRNNIWINPNEIPNNGKDDDNNGLVDDLYGFDFARYTPEVQPRGVTHGTMTASVVAGDGTGGTITGVAPRARIMPLVAFGGAYNAARAFEYALDQGAHVVNMSFSIPKLGNVRGLWRRIAENATSAGLLLISGAGNFPREPIPVQIRIPEGIPCVLCVGGVNRRKEFARFTSRGPVTWEDVKFYEDHPMPKGLIKPDIVALPGPGIGLVSSAGVGYLPENNRKRGNSLSAPHVAGIAALVWSVNRELTPWRVREIIEQSAEDLPPKGKDSLTGFGLVNAERAVRLLKTR